MNSGRKTVFLDRDGLINRKAPEHRYIESREDFEFLPGAADGIRRLNDAGYLVILVTNQRGVARGTLTLNDVENIHGYMREELKKAGARIDGIYVCPHNEGECGCRKPDIGLFMMAEKDFAIDKSASWMVGDSETDVEAGKKYGVRTILTDNLLGAAETIISTDGD